jgi:hypothetical protein
VSSLKNIFSRVAFKTLVEVDLLDRGSNQHELNGNAALRSFFDTDQKIVEEIELHYYQDGVDPEHATTRITFYDARERSAERTGRSEWRMYYVGDFLKRASPGDLLVLARTPGGALHGFIFEDGSGWHRAALDLFPIDDAQSSFRLPASDALSDQEVRLVGRQILDQLEIEFEPDVGLTTESAASRLLEEYGFEFPPTRIMAAEARTLADVEAADVDSAIHAWLDAEEQLFYAMERQLLTDRISRGFDSVDNFLAIAQTTLQRRKSRMGLSLQHHAAEIFRIRGLLFSSQGVTELKKKPDFLFPGAREYHDARFDRSTLRMLGVKSTCKDRWRQILSEAERIPHKHLLTLDQALSVDQLKEMDASCVQLVVPEPFQEIYARSLRAQMMTLEEFVEEIAQLQMH